MRPPIDGKDVGLNGPTRPLLLLGGLRLDLLPDDRLNPGVPPKLQLDNVRVPIVEAGEPNMYLLIALSPYYE